MGFPLDHLWEDELDAFAERVLREFPDFVTEMFRLYQPIDFVGRQESLAPDLIKALKMAGVECDWKALSSTPVANAAPSKPLDQGLADRLDDANRWVLETFYA
jgi:hypothetical protein